MIRSVVIGSGSALPGEPVNNVELARLHNLDTSDEWIVERTGIRQRHIAGEGETTSTLAIQAARAALADAGIDASDIDLIVLATATPDNTFPASATQVQRALGCTGGIAFDVAAVCTGFLYAVTVADSMLRAGHAKRALVGDHLDPLVEAGHEFHELCREHSLERVKALLLEFPVQPLGVVGVVVCRHEENLSLSRHVAEPFTRPLGEERSKKGASPPKKTSDFRTERSRICI